MKILIAGDMVVNRKYDPHKMIDKSVKFLFAQSDYNIVNLEAPVSESNSKILKTGPHLKAEKESTKNVLKVLQIAAVTLANNHLKDFDEQGVADTLQFCYENNIVTVGGGMNLQEASKILYIDSEDGKIGIVNFAENEWASAGSDSAGANPIDVIDNARHIQEAKKNADFVFVIVHGGHEYYNLPSPRMQKHYRFYAEQGADVVVGHHTHCISGNEVYKGVPIYYSLGNFLFTKNNLQEDWYNGLLLEIEIKNRKLSTLLYAIEQEKDTFKLNLSEDNAAFERMNEFNKVIENSKSLNDNWMIYVNERSKSYLHLWSPLSFVNNRFIRAILNRLNINISNKKGLALYLNLMSCEAHADLSKEILRKQLLK